MQVKSPQLITPSRQRRGGWRSERGRGEMEFIHSTEINLHGASLSIHVPRLGALRNYQANHADPLGDGASEAPPPPLSPQQSEGARITQCRMVVFEASLNLHTSLNSMHVETESLSDSTEGSRTQSAVGMNMIRAKRVLVRILCLTCQCGFERHLHTKAALLQKHEPNKP